MSEYGFCVDIPEDVLVVSTKKKQYKITTLCKNRFFDIAFCVKINLKTRCKTGEL